MIQIKCLSTRIIPIVVPIILGCQPSAQNLPGNRSFSAISVNSSSVSLSTFNSSQDLTLAISPPSGAQNYTSLSINLGIISPSSQICTGTAPLGVQGTATCTAPTISTAIPVNPLLTSTTYHSPVSNVLPQYQVMQNYSSNGNQVAPVLPGTNGYSYSEAPDIWSQDDGINFYGYCVSPTYKTAYDCLNAGHSESWIGICINLNYNAKSTCQNAGHGEVWDTSSDSPCNGTGGASDTCGHQIPFGTYVHSNYVDCGGAGMASLNASIQDCAMKNTGTSTWNGALLGTYGESTWVMVAHQGGTGSNQEVWKDLRTNLLWSSPTSNHMNWCQATGSNDSTLYCVGNAKSACAEFSGPISGTPASSFNTTENFSTGVYDNAKGGMGLLTTPSIRWRAPSNTEVMQAYIDGLTYVVPNHFFTSGVWTTTRVSNTSQAWATGSLGNTVQYMTASTIGAICVGR